MFAGIYWILASVFFAQALCGSFCENLKKYDELFQRSFTLFFLRFGILLAIKMRRTRQSRCDRPQLGKFDTAVSDKTTGKLNHLCHLSALSLQKLQLFNCDKVQKLAKCLKDLIMLSLNLWINRVLIFASIMLNRAG